MAPKNKPSISRACTFLCMATQMWPEPDRNEAKGSLLSKKGQSSADRETQVECPTTCERDECAAVLCEY